MSSGGGSICHDKQPADPAADAAEAPQKEEEEEEEEEDDAAIVADDNPVAEDDDAEDAEEDDVAVVQDKDKPVQAEEAAATATVVVDLVTELKAEGTTLFRRRDYNGAASKFDEAIRCSPRAPVRDRDDDVASLHSNVAACYMHMTTTNPADGEQRHYHQAIDRCNMALAASPRYTKALLKRARCFEALDRLDLACGDVQEALTFEPNNVVALELLDTIKEEIEDKKLMLEQEASSLDELLKAISSVGAADRRATDTVHHGGQEKHQHSNNGAGEETHVSMPPDHGNVAQSDEEEDQQEEEEQATLIQ